MGSAECGMKKEKSLSIPHSALPIPHSAVPSEPLLAPRVAIHVITALLPITCAVCGDKLDPANPFGALPSVKLRHDGAHRATVFERNRLPIVRVGQQRVFG